jgi:CheY-like chemotaxis protein
MTQPQTADGRGNILIVDDTPANLRLLGAMLSEQGYKTRAVMNGQMALTAARSAPPDLILLDINMPDVSGYEVCRALKADEHTREIPVIFVSALDEALDKVKAFEVGGVDYITKPVQFEEVIMRVSTHLNLHRLQRAATSGGRGDERATPAALVALLGRSAAHELQPGDYAAVTGGLLVAMARSGAADPPADPAAQLAAVNLLLGGLGAIARRNGGFVERWRSTSAAAIFPGGLDQALAAARELRGAVERQNQGRQNSGEAPLAIRVGLCNRTFVLGVVGDESQIQITWLDGAEEVIIQIEQAVRQSTDSIIFIDS